MDALLEAQLAKLLERGLDYRQLHFGIDWNFIHMQSHFDAVAGKGVKYEKTQYNIVRFSTASESRPGMRHDVWIQMAELDDIIADPNYKMYDKVRLAMTGSLRVHCSCEAFMYYGYKFILTQLDTALEPENRPPNVRNPMRHGTVCKHIAAVLKVFPFWISTVAGELKAQGFDNYQPATVSWPAQPDRGRGKGGLPPPPPAGTAGAVQAPRQQPGMTQVTAPQQRRPGESLEGGSFWNMVETEVATLPF